MSNPAVVCQLSDHNKPHRNRNCQCPDCAKEGIDVWFFSRKARHHHQMVAHRKPRTEGTKRTRLKNLRKKVNDLEAVFGGADEQAQ